MTDTPEVPIAVQPAHHQAYPTELIGCPQQHQSIAQVKRRAVATLHLAIPLGEDVVDVSAATQTNPNISVIQSQVPCSYDNREATRVQVANLVDVPPRVATHRQEINLYILRLLPKGCKSLLL